MKEKIAQMYIQALIDDLAPNVFAEQILNLLSDPPSLPSILNNEWTPRACSDILKDAEKHKGDFYELYSLLGELIVNQFYYEFKELQVLLELIIDYMYDANKKAYFDYIDNIPISSNHSPFFTTVLLPMLHKKERPNAYGYVQ